jgi:outer membrane protein TolC
MNSGSLENWKSMKQRIKITYLILAGLLQALVSFAQVTTLDDVLNAVASNNPMLKQYESKAQALDAYAEGARSWMAPMVGAGTFMTPYPRQEVMDGDKGSIMFSVEQQIPNGSRLKASEKYLQSQSAIQRTARETQFNMLRADARMAYYKWLIAERKRSALDDNVGTLQLMKQLAEVRYPYNQGSLGDIYKLTGKIAAAENMVSMTDGDIGEARARLLSLMNLPGDTPMTIDTSTTVRVYALASDTSTLREKRSDIRQLDQRIRSMQLNRSLQLTLARPDFRIRFDHMQPRGDMPVQFTAMAMVSIPIAPWSSRMYKAEVRGMAHDIRAMREEREAILSESAGKITGMSKKLQAMERQLGNYKTSIIPALQRNFRVNMLAYEENRGQLASVLDAWEALNMMQLEYFDRLEAFYTMIADYEKELEQ